MGLFMRVLAKLLGLICCLTGMPTLAALPLATDDILHFSTAVPTTNKHFQHQQQVIAALCSRLRWHCSLEAYAAPQAEKLLRTGKIDGEVGRDASFASVVPQALRIATTLTEVRYVALLRKDHRQAARANSWESLRHWRVAYLRGNHFIDKHKDNKTWQAIDKEQSCLNLVQTKRVDACVVTHGKATQLIRQLGNKGHQFKVFEVKRDSRYLYLARHRAGLLSQMDAMMQVMHRDGSLDAIYRRNLGPPP